MRATSQVSSLSMQGSIDSAVANRRIGWALLLALMLEALVFVVLRAQIPAPPPSAPAPVLQLRLAPRSTPVVASRLALPVRPVPPLPVLSATPATPVHSRARRWLHPLPTTLASMPAAARVSAAHPSGGQPPGAANTSRQPGAPAAVESGAASRYAEQLRQAIQAAVRYPESERALGRQGVVRLGFVLQDGGLTQIRLLHGSGRPGLDRAALQAAARTAAPPPPNGLALNGEQYQLNIVFELQTAP